MSSALVVHRLADSATIPVRGSALAAGVDLAAAEATVVPARGKATISTGMRVEVPDGTYARVAPRSGLAAKKMIDVGAGVVDAAHTGEISVLLYNHGPEDFQVAVSDRIAQLILEEVATHRCDVVEVDTLAETARGAGGFGSTGVAGDAGDAHNHADSLLAVSELQGGRHKFMVKKLRPDAKLPERGSPSAAGFVVYAAEELVLQPGGKGVGKTGLAMAAPAGTYARVAPLGGPATSHMLKWGAGVVDSDYRGEVGVVLFNFSPEEVRFAPGDAIAQIILQDVSMVGCEEVADLEATNRGAGGFGSTGVGEASVPSATDEKKGGEGGVEEAREPKKARLGDRPATPLASMTAKLRVKKTMPEAVLPKRGTKEAAGFDLAAAEATTIPAGGKAIVKTGLNVGCPENTYGLIASRSGLAVKKMLHCGAGVVDADYRGDVGVVLFNHGPEDFKVEIGDRIAQLILQKARLFPCQAA